MIEESGVRLEDGISWLVVSGLCCFMWYVFVFVNHFDRVVRMRKEVSHQLTDEHTSLRKLSPFKSDTS